jgi:hypothetical protein
MQLISIDRITALFNALAVHVYMICTSYTIDQGLAEIRARVCMMGLASMQESWPVGGWVLKLFDSIMERLKQPLQERQAKSRKTTVKQKTNKQNEVDDNSAVEPVSFSNNQEAGTDVSSPLETTSQQLLNHKGMGTKAGNNAQSAFGTVTKPIPEIDFTLIPNMFAFDDPMGQTSSDRASFFHWLDFSNLYDVEQDPWPN